MLLRLHRSSPSACTAAISNGMCTGRHPAITALTAIFHGVARRFADGRTAISSSAKRLLWATYASTRSIVGATIGSRSVHSLAWKNCVTASGVPVKTISR